METGSFRFGRFCLDPGDRRLTSGGEPVELNARYLDALVLLVREQGKLVSKDRFLDEVWRGVPVTDEALTQAIKTLRRQLGDEASNPRFIETVPKHGYRFIAPAEWVAGDGAIRSIAAAPAESVRYSWREAGLIGLAGTAGGGIAGIFGGLFYGLIGALQPLGPEMGALSVLLVLLCVTLVVALVGAAGVSFGIAATLVMGGRLSAWSAAGGAIGGFIVGALVKLVGLDAFQLLLGRSPGDFTGAAEGAFLGAAIGLGAWLGAERFPSSLARRAGLIGALLGAAAGILIILLGGRLLGGSLDLLARQFPNSRLRFDQIGATFGEAGFGPVTQMLTGGLEGFLFGGCVVAAMALARRGFRPDS